MAALEEKTAAGLAQGRIVGTDRLADALVQLGDRARLDRVFQSLFEQPAPPQDRYLARLDYARALVRLHDDSAEDSFRQALAVAGANHLGAYNSYAEWLIQRNRKQDAFDLLSAMPAALRRRSWDPAVRRDALIDELGLAATKDAVQRTGVAGVGPVTGKDEELARLVSLQYVHSNTGDDCRSPGSPVTCLPYNGSCYYDFVINLAEVLFNEARSETWGAIDMVGWTVRDRAYEKPSCNAYVGGFGGTCSSNIACSEPDACDLSKRYCCVIHGGTLTVGTAQSQFNDTHVPFSTLGADGFLNEAYLVINGLVPDPSTSFVATGVSGCTFGCTRPICTSGANTTAPSPSGPMEFMDVVYTPADSACMAASGKMCGNGGGDNYFWNRKP